MKIRIKNYYFPNGLRYTWAILSLAYIIYDLFWLKGHYWLIIFLFLSSILLFTVYTEIIIDRRRNQIISTSNILLLPIKSKGIHARKLHRIRLDKERVTYTTNSAKGGRTGQADFFIYSAILEYDSEKEFEILSRADWHPFIERMKEIAKNLNVELFRNF